MSIFGIEVRQPAPGDIVGGPLQVAALGTASEATYVWRLVRTGETLAEGHFTAGSMGSMQTFVVQLTLDCDSPAGKAVFELSTDWAADEAEAPAPEPQRVDVIFIPGAVGYIPREVKVGETLSEIVVALGMDSNVTNIENVALASGIDDAHDLHPGQIIRIPV